MCMVQWVIRKSEIGPERAPLSEKHHSIEEKKWKMPSPAEWMNTWVSLWTFGRTAWIIASAKSTLNSLQVSKGYNKTGRVIYFKMHRLGWGRSRGGGYSSHKKSLCESRRNQQLISSLFSLLYLSTGGYFCHPFYVDAKGCCRCRPPCL